MRVQQIKLKFNLRLKRERFLIRFSVWIAIDLIQMHGFKCCLEKERIALMEIKSSFVSVSDSEYADNILTSWVDNGICDVAVWEGVK